MIRMKHFEFQLPIKRWLYEFLRHDVEMKKPFMSDPHCQNWEVSCGLELNFVDREQRSKVLKEALLFLLAWNQVPKMFQIEQKLCKVNKNEQENQKCAWEQKMCKGTKNLLRNKKCASVAHFGIELSCLNCMAFSGLVWSCIALFGLVWSGCFSRPWPSVASFNLACHCVT